MLWFIFVCIDSVSEETPVLLHHEQQLAQLLEALDHRLTSSYLADSQTPTIADVSAVCQLLSLNLLKHLNMQRYKNIMEWVDRVAETCGSSFFSVTKAFGTKSGRSVLTSRHELVDYANDIKMDETSQIASNGVQKLLDLVDRREYKRDGRSIAIALSEGRVVEAMDSLKDSKKKKDCDESSTSVCMSEW